MELRDLLTDQEFIARKLKSHSSKSGLDAMRRLALVFADGQETILQSLVDAAVAFTGADSAGISLLQGLPDAPHFRWMAVSGCFAKYAQATTPRFFSPCGICLDAGRPQLYRVTKPYFDFLGMQASPITDGILIPWENHAFRGTIWVASHTSPAAFEFDDYNLLNSLAEFAFIALEHHTREKDLRHEVRNAASAAMANDLAHEINNPLQGLTNSLFLARQGGPSAQAYLEQAA